MKTGFLEESGGNKSANRLVFVVGSFWNFLLCSYFALQSVDPTTILAVFAGIEGALTGLKLGQKVMEKKQLKTE